MSGTWIYLVILYAILKGTREGMKKAAVKISGTNEILFFYTLIGLILTLPFSKSAFSLDGIYIFYSFVKASVCCTAWIFSLYALKQISVSLYGIMDLSRMIFSSMLGVLILGESFTIAKAIGMILVITGLVMVNMKNSSTSKGMTVFTLFAVLMNCLLNAISGIIDKILMRHIESSQLQFWFMLFIMLIYTVVLMAKKEKLSFKTLKKNYWIPLMSVSLILGDKLLFEANAYPESQVTVMTLLKQSSVIVTIFTGWIVFKEKHILYKLMCSAIVIVGIAIPLIFK